MDPLPKSLIREINHLNHDQLHSLHHYITNRLVTFQKAEDFVALRRFTLLDCVSFQHDGVTKKGTIIRLNQRSVTVLLDGGPDRWNVSPHMLTKVIDVQSPMAITKGNSK